MIKSKIKNDIEKEFQNLQNELKIHLENKTDLKTKKDFLSKHIPNEIVFKSKLLLNSILVYLTEQSKNELKNSDLEINNEFLRANLKEKVRNLILEKEGEILKENNQVTFSYDPRIVAGIATGSIPLIIGATVIGLVFPKVGIASIVTGLASVLLSGATFKVTYDKSANLAHNKIKSDVEKYLTVTEKFVIEWLFTVINVYQAEFQKFCKHHNIKIEKINE